MGLLVDGKWHDQWYDTDSTGGRFKRQESAFRSWITADGSPGPSGEGGFEAEPDRYHMYVAYACPWASRALVFRKLKGLERLLPISVVNPLMKENGWTFEPGYKVVPDPIHGARYLYEVYTAADPEYTGRVTVPTIWDKKKNTIVNNESAEIIRMLNSAFDDVGAKPGDYYPEDLRERIDEINEVVYHKVNNGVYKAGFATAQEAYEEAVIPLFETLDWLERILSENRYLCGPRVTEADWRLFTTLIRFDAVYVGHFKCNIRRIDDYPNLSNYLRELYQWPGIAETVEFHAIKLHYYASHEKVNPTGIVPVGPALDFHREHDRDRLPADEA
ncbi:MAG: glutathione S-transferase family protein [Wenzhouxiangellaceae bacterium]|nr:glutathione S-transferase family protein [Wenzhouxiangellaceae bacterium]